MNIWTRNGNVWTMLPLPCVTVEPAKWGGWEARCNGVPVHGIPHDRSSAVVRAAVYKYYDERVELYG